MHCDDSKTFIRKSSVTLADIVSEEWSGGEAILHWAEKSLGREAV